MLTACDFLGRLTTLFQLCMLGIKLRLTLFSDEL
jgi:hypothetical protein